MSMPVFNICKNRKRVASSSIKNYDERHEIPWKTEDFLEGKHSIVTLLG